MNLTQYIGRPYVDKVHDCWALVRQVLKDQFGLSVPSYSDLYASSDISIQTERAAYLAASDGRWERVQDPAPGDVIIFRVGPFACHAGLYVGNDDFIHCLRGRQTTVEGLSQGWRERIDGVYRWRQT